MVTCTALGRKAPTLWSSPSISTRAESPVTSTASEMALSPYQRSLQFASSIPACIAHRGVAATGIVLSPLLPRYRCASTESPAGWTRTVCQDIRRITSTVNTLAITFYALISERVFSISMAPVACCLEIWDASGPLAEGARQRCRTSHPAWWRRSSAAARKSYGMADKLPARNDDASGVVCL
jgi:hypothetical protein